MTILSSTNSTARPTRTFTQGAPLSPEVKAIFSALASNASDSLKRAIIALEVKATAKPVLGLFVTNIYEAAGGDPVTALKLMAKSLGTELSVLASASIPNAAPQHSMAPDAAPAVPRHSASPAA